MPEHRDNEEFSQKSRTEADISMDRIREELRILRDHLEELTGNRKQCSAPEPPRPEAV
jgi:hypothetical protein